MTLGGLTFNLKERIDAAELRVAARTQRLAAAAAPVLLNALVVGDLATAEQTLRNINVDLVWQRVRLFEPDGRTLILDASPEAPPHWDAPRWLRRLLSLHTPESRILIAAEPVTYAVLAVTPSSGRLESELWHEVRAAVAITALLIGTLLVLMSVILVYGLRPVRALAESAARFGGGDFSVRLPETGFAEMVPTVGAFNTMADNLNRVLAELRAKEAAHRRLAAIIEQSEEAIITVDVEHQVRASSS